jgi:hypothetical protein
VDLLGDFEVVMCMRRVDMIVEVVFEVERRKFVELIDVEESMKVVVLRI